MSIMDDNPGADRSDEFVNKARTLVNISVQATLANPAGSLSRGETIELLTATIRANCYQLAADSVEHQEASPREAVDGLLKLFAQIAVDLMICRGAGAAIPTTFETAAHTFGLSYLQYAARVAKIARAPGPRQDGGNT